MRPVKIFVLFLILASATRGLTLNGAIAQPPRGVTDTIGEVTQYFRAADRLPGFAGGEDSVRSFIERNIELPSYLKLNYHHVKGRVLIGFTVEKDGSLTDLEVLRSLDTQLDSCALEVIRKMPPWEPALKDGYTIRMRTVLPVIIEN